MIIVQLQHRNLLERILLGIVVVIVLVIAFFFLAAAIVVGAVLAAVLLARIWWVRRKITQAAEQQFITTEFQVVEREWESGGRLPDESGRQRHSGGRPSDADPGMNQAGSGGPEVESPPSEAPLPDKNTRGQASRE